MDVTWPRGITSWIDNRVIHLSIPFTWNLPEARKRCLQRGFDYDSVLVGGPAVKLMPDYLRGLPNVTIGDSLLGVLQRVNPQATRTTTGCIRRCKFCAVPRLEPGKIVELADWPDLPVICDNNILAASDAHFDRVCERLSRHGWADFNQGLDARLLTPWHAKRLNDIGKAKVRLACDHESVQASWEGAFDVLRNAGFAAGRIFTYALIAFDDGPVEAWRRCEWLSKYKVLVCPMWHHNLDQLQENIVRPDQAALGWTEKDRTDIMGYYYKHRGTPPPVPVSPPTP